MPKPKSELFIAPIPGVNPGKFRHRTVYLLATEEFDILHFVDTDDPVQACRYAKKNFPGYHIAVFTDRAFEEPKCRVIRDLPLWARRARLDVALAEGECDWLKNLQNGLGRDLFFQGIGAFVEWQDEVVALQSDFAVAVNGTLQSERIDAEVKLFIHGEEPPQISAAVRHHRSTRTKSFDVTIGQEPQYLIPLFEQAFDLPAVPRLDRTDAGTGRDAPISNAELGAFGHALGSAMQTRSDPVGGRVRAENPLYDLEAGVRRLDKSS